MNNYHQIQEDLINNPRKWLVTGVAGFIGSNILRSLLKLKQNVVGLDNFATGHQHNLDLIRKEFSKEAQGNFKFIEGDILDIEVCKDSTKDIDIVLHQAALGSVPRSIKDPITSNNVNIQGFLNMITSARDSGVKSFVYAASSSTYGDHPDLPKVEERIGRPLSPYAVTKFVNELYAEVFHRTYGFNSIGLRYFNVFGPSQDPNGAYAAVVPKWIESIKRNEIVTINGDGKTSRDFCFVENAVQANILAATVTNENAKNQIYNVAVGDQTSLIELHKKIQDAFKKNNSTVDYKDPNFGEFREGDVKHSLADISKAHKLLGYQPEYKVTEGIEKTVSWYLNKEEG
jgi:UDP-N-acetylglucosamine 4-epimerase